MERQITKKEEQIYRCRHHNFDGLTTKQTAKRLNVSEASIQRTLRQLKRDFPQLFPILTKQQAFIQNCICEEGMTHGKISALLGISKNTLKARVMRLKKKGIFLERPRKMLQYKPHMDVQVRDTF